jgi:hypothetical protein
MAATRKKRVKKVSKARRAAKARKVVRKAAAKRPVRKASSKKPVRKAAPRKAARKAAAKRPARKAAPRRLRPVVPMSPARAAAPAAMPDLSRLETIVTQVTESASEHPAAEGTKFDIGVRHNGMALPYAELPSEYGKDRAVILVVDPRFVFTYWEIRGDSLGEAHRAAGPGGKLTLRFYDISATGNPETSGFWDVEVFDRLGNWYLRLAHPEQHLCLDVGVKNPQGYFHCIARSNVMRLPPQSLAKPGPIKWMVVSPSGEKVVSDVEEYTDADLALLKKILGPYFFDLLMRGRLASIAGSSIEAVFYDVQMLNLGFAPSSVTSWQAAP